MKKLLSFVLALLLIGGGFSTISYADVQIGEGQSLSTAGKIWFVGRSGRTGNVGLAGANEISKDSVVIWDTTSNDGVSVRVTTTSSDALVAGVTMDIIKGSSTDNTAAEDENANPSNWGRVQVWGRHADVRFQVCALPFSCAAGMLVGTGSTSQDAAVFRAASFDATATLANLSHASRDSFGVMLETPAVTDTTVDVFIKNM